MIGGPLFPLGAVIIALGVLAIRANQTSPTNRWFAVFAGSTGLWIIAIAIVYSNGSPTLWSRVAFAAASLIPFGLLGFVDNYPRPISAYPRSRYVCWAIAIGLCIVSIPTPLMMIEVAIADGQPQRTPGLLYPVFVIYFALTWIIALINLLMKWRTTRGGEKSQLNFLVTSMFVSLSGGMTTNLVYPFITGESTYSWVGPYFSLLFIGLTGHSIIRHRSLDLRVVVHRGLTFAIAVVLSLVPVAVL